MGPALDLLAGELAVATEVTNLAVALGKLKVDSKNDKIELRGDSCWSCCPQGAFRPQAAAGADGSRK